MITATQMAKLRELTDKSSWGPGPWQEEVDSFQWKDKKTGLTCFAARNTMGAWCGYAGVGMTHPLYGVGYSECTKKTCESYCDHTPESILRVHGGITFAAHMHWEKYRPVDRTEKIARCLGVETKWFLGFDCGHAGDGMPGLEAREKILFGFAKLALPRTGYKTLDYVKRECAKLAKQLAAYK